MKEYNVIVISDMFGYMKFRIDEDEAHDEDVWITINKYLDVNLFVHPEEEGKMADGADPTSINWLASIWSTKMDNNMIGTYNEEIEHVATENVIVS